MRSSLTVELLSLLLLLFNVVMVVTGPLVACSLSKFVKDSCIAKTRPTNDANRVSDENNNMIIFMLMMNF